MDRPINNEKTFGPAEAGPDPFALFEQWYAAALQEAPRDAGVMTLATSAENKPSARMVLLKEHGPDGFVFYTNYESRKAREMETNPQAALVFWWPSFAKATAGGPSGPEKQIRIEGRIEKTSAEESDAYFSTRPRDSQLSAWVSAQSSVIDAPVSLDDARKKFGDGPIPRPCSWGGMRLIPERFEFWQGRASRLHDRVLFETVESGWTIKRLAP